MSKRISTEARLLDWIDTADLNVVQSIMTIANARVKARVKAGSTITSVPPRPKRVVKRRRVNAAPAQTDTAVTNSVGAA